jgi:hypothetical protein
MNNVETKRYIELLKRRAASLRLMAKDLRECRESFTSMDLDAIREHNSYQKSLCSEIRGLDEELAVLRRQLVAEAGLAPEGSSAAPFVTLFDTDSTSQLRQVTDELAAAQNGVRRLNHVHAGLLKRSRRSINVLFNVLANYAGTYNPSPGWSVRSFPW